LDLILVDWENKFVDVIYQYWMRSGNDTFLHEYWPNMVAMVGYIVSSSIDPVTHFSTNGGSGPTLQSTALAIQTLEEMVEMGNYLGYNSSTTLVQYQLQSQLCRKATESLWNATGGFFAEPGTTSWLVGSVAWIELLKIGTQAQRDSFWSLLPTRQVAAGYDDPPAGVNQFNLLAAAGLKPVNPNEMSNILWALGERRDGITALDLLGRTWGPMVEKNVNFTGGYWEFVSPDGLFPGNDLETAQSHFWGGFPTAFLTEYVLGVQPTKPGFVEFEVKPLADFATGWNEGRVPTPHGLIYTAWGYDTNGKIHMEITAPKGTTGTVCPPFSGSYSLNGKAGKSGTFIVKGGTGKVTVVQS